MTTLKNSIPNWITLLRLLMVPFISVLLAEHRYGWGLAVYIVAALSDGVDGFLARRWSVTSRIGALLDPVADKMIVIAAAFVLAWHGLLPLWLTLPLIARDVLMLGIGLTDPRLQDGWLPPNRMGKAHAALAFLAIIATLAQAAGVIDSPALLGALYLVVFVTIFVSGGLYFAAWRRHRRGG
jgi:cardiolipin synthase (CMP-forming)